MQSLIETENVEPLYLVEFYYPGSDDKPLITGFRFFKYYDYDKFLSACTISFRNESDQYVYWGPDDPNYLIFETIEDYLSCVTVKEVTYDTYRKICDALELSILNYSLVPAPEYELLETYGLFLTPNGIW